MELKKNISLILGLSIPVLMIIFVAGSIYLPALFVHPKTDFLYVNYDNNYYYTQYSIVAGKLVKNPDENLTHKSAQKSEAKLYLHDVQKNTSREVSFEEAKNLKLNSNIVSPDGFEVSYGGGGGGGMFPFFFDSGPDYNSRFLTGHGYSKKLNIQKSGSYYLDFRFLGWIEK
ncbi:hypothetical protein D4R52_01285, partial [bacterium]